MLIYNDPDDDCAETIPNKTGAKENYIDFDNSKIDITKYLDKKTLEMFNNVEFNINMEVTLYPNPSSEKVDIEIDSPVSDRVQIYLLYLQGRKLSTIFVGELQEGKSVIPWSINDETPKGVYLIELDFENSTKVTQKLIIN